MTKILIAIYEEGNTGVKKPARKINKAQVKEL